MKPIKTLIIDNYDSFTYNLYQYIGELKGNPVVYTNNTITIATIRELAPSHIIISPGPGTVTNPADFGIGTEVILKCGPTTPLLGVCLGHQGIVHAFGGTIEHASQIMHGKQSLVEHDHSTLFRKIPNPLKVMRYHSLCGSRKNFPKDLKITSWEKEENTIMAIEHSQYPIFGIQFHPESFLTEFGKTILENFLSVKIHEKKSFQ